MAVVPWKNSTSGSNSVPTRTRRASVFLTTRYCPFAARTCRRSSVTWGTLRPL